MGTRHFPMASLTVLQLKLMKSLRFGRHTNIATADQSFRIVVATCSKQDSGREIYAGMTQEGKEVRIILLRGVDIDAEVLIGPASDFPEYNLPEQATRRPKK